MTAASRIGSGISVNSAPALDLPARFFALAMLNLLLVAVSSPFALPLLAQGYGGAHVLAFVHLNTLGVVATVVVGAGYQLAPVVLQTKLASERIGRIAFWLHVCGLALFIPGLLRGWIPCVGIGATLLFTGLLLTASVVVRTFRQSPHRDVVAWHLLVAQAGLAGGVLFGLLLALNEATGFLGAHTPRLLAAHITLLFGGWIAVLLSGVAYRLVGMFTLSKAALWTPVAWAGLALTAGGAWWLALGFVFGARHPILLIGVLAMLVGQIQFSSQLLHLYQVRRRRGTDIHIPFALVAIGCGLASTGLLSFGFLSGTGPGSSLWIAVIWLALAGLAETAIQAFLYKIATFLVWLHRYAPLAGRWKVPKLEDLYDIRLAGLGWACWTIGLMLEVGGILTSDASICRIGGLSAAVGLALFLVNLARIVSHRQPLEQNETIARLRLEHTQATQEGKPS